MFASRWTCCRTRARRSATPSSTYAETNSTSGWTDAILRASAPGSSVVRVVGEPTDHVHVPRRRISATAPSRPRFRTGRRRSSPRSGASAGRGAGAGRRRSAMNEIARLPSTAPLGATRNTSSPAVRRRPSSRRRPSPRRACRRAPRPWRRARRSCCRSCRGRSGPPAAAGCPPPGRPARRRGHPPGRGWIGRPSTPPDAFTMSAATCTPRNSSRPPGPCEPLSG